MTDTTLTAAATIALLTAAPMTASAADTKDNEVSGLVVPFNEMGDTSAGRFAVARDAIALPDDLGEVKLFRDHSNAGGSPVGYATHAEIKDDGLYMSFHVADTPDGKAAMADVRARVRDALSVELREFEMDGDTIVSGSLSAVALVPVPAYRRARVEPSRAATLASSLSSPLLTASKSEGISLANVSAALMASAAGHNLDNSLTAALQQVKSTTSQASTQAEWLGELWDGGAYKRRIIPTLTSRALKSDKMKGWKWVKRPEIADYAGDLAAIASNELEVKEVEVSASRLAAGHKFDRKHIDFNDSEFMQSYLAAMRDSYARKSDAKAGAFVVAEAAKVAKTKELTGKNILESMAIANETIEDSLEVSPTTYLVNPADRRALIEITNNTAPAYLDLLGIDPKKLIPFKSVPKKTLIAYAKPAITYGELGSTPIRVNALDIANGGSDEAMFGYYALMVNDDRGIAQVKFS
ncbi:hypothetical protein [Corynebacterium diphtheriae]|uniref:phage major capsid protein n=1 Tax=Corynebacterium diphtheriae TaxID=1717 RepID=UPI0018C967C5|nr:hypothetical protein [Corynebacterium diphtheriae]MBG9336926.1 hypothetical protein [Corynebacterium diphtheriae bv. gravis]